MVAQRYHGNFLSIHDNMTKLFPSVKKFFLHDKIFRSAKTFIVRERAGHNHACVHKKMALPGRCGFQDKCELNCQIFLSRKKENRSKPPPVWPVVIALPSMNKMCRTISLLS